MLFVEAISKKQSSTQVNDRRGHSFFGEAGQDRFNNASVPRKKNRISVRLEIAPGKTANKFIPPRA